MQNGPAELEQVSQSAVSFGAGKQTKMPSPLRSQASPAAVSQGELVTGLHSDFGTQASLQGPWKHVASATNVVLLWQTVESVMLPSTQPEQSLSPRQSMVS